MEPRNEHQTKYDGTSCNVGAQQHEASAATATLTETTNIPGPTVAASTKKPQYDFIFGKCIGEGSFSTVYLGKDKNTRREYAIKVCDKRHILREHKQEYVRREREVLQIMTNVPGFVKLLCTFQDSRSLYFVMTYAENGELLPHIKRVGCFSVECARHYAAELVLACEQMHKRNVVHRDLKPENILLDRQMHTLIADFGSAKVLTNEDIAAAKTYQAQKQCSSTSLESQEPFDDDDSDDLFNEPDINDPENFYRPQRFRTKRKASFVGTAQYVSPEVLQNAPISPAADLWALGCILYQMVAGLPPFRGHNDFAVFKEILACKIDFPECFDENAKDLVCKLLTVKPHERLGAQDDYNQNGYISIRQHLFFADVDFKTIREREPPTIFPYLPCFSNEDCKIETATSTIERDLENILNLGLFNDKSPSCDLTPLERNKILEQQKIDKWHPFADNEIILKKGLVHKHKGLFASTRMLLLTTGPHLLYIDPVEMIKCGEIPWGPELRGELRNNRIFFIHTSDRTYFFEALESSGPEWISAIRKVHRHTYQTDAMKESSSSSSQSPVKELK